MTFQIQLSTLIEFYPGLFDNTRPNKLLCLFPIFPSMDSVTHQNASSIPMRSKFFSSLGPHGFHRIHYTEWGQPDNPNVVVCVHGLTRNCRDFDPLAKAMAETHRVVCPDMPGRGKSDWLENKLDYNAITYMSDIAVLIGRLDVEEIDWIGTSMGGWIGMLLASQSASPIRRMLLNDIGPEVSPAAQKRITQYLTSVPVFRDVANAERYFRTIHAPFGPLTDSQWQHLTQHSIHRSDDDNYTVHYDPGIAEPYKNQQNALVTLWEQWDKIRCPVHIFRGQESDLLTKNTTAKMLSRGPDSCLTELPGIGHAPALMAEDQIAMIKDWFYEPPPSD